MRKRSSYLWKKTEASSFQQILEAGSTEMKVDDSIPSNIYWKIASKKLKQIIINYSGHIF